MQDWNLTDQIAGLENAGLENAGLKSDELRLKQPQTSSTIDVSELSYMYVYVMLYYLTDNNAVRLQRKCNKQQHNISRSLPTTNEIYCQSLAGPQRVL